MILALLILAIWAELMVRFVMLETAIVEQLLATRAVLLENFVMLETAIVEQLLATRAVLLEKFAMLELAIVEQRHVQMEKYATAEHVVSIKKF